MTPPAKPERSAAVSGRAAVAPEALDQWPAGFDRVTLSALHRLTSGLASQHTSDEMLGHFAECALALFKQASHVSIHTTTDGHDAHPVVFNRHGDKLYMPIPRSIRNLVLDGGEAVSFVDSDANLSDSDSLQGADVRAGLCAPLLVEDRTYGFVQIDCRGNMLGTFPQGDIQLLAVMTHQLALALDNLRLQAQLQNSIAKLKLAKTEMEQLAFVDPLTELSNRRLFLHRLDHSVESARRAGSSVCLLYLDLDDFKQINDTLGHGIGDDLLRDRGVSIAIDDFGTGYSSLSYIKKFPADILKLDQSFIRGIGRNKSDTEIASAVIAMAHKLNMKVIAEGIEKRKQLAFLNENGCDYGQGFLWGRPADLSTAVKPAKIINTVNTSRRCRPAKIHLSVRHTLQPAEHTWQHTPATATHKKQAYEL